MRQLLYTSIALLFVVIFTTGCTNQNEQGATEKPLLTMTPTVTQVTEVVSTNTPKSTNTPTLLPSFTPEATLIPTLPRDQALQAILDLYADNGGCQLPCWWGITPGVTTWEDAYSRLSPLGRVFGPMENTSRVKRYDFEFIVPTYIDPWEYYMPVIWVKDGIVRGIATNSGSFRNDFSTSLAGWLAQLGEPAEIWLDPSPISPTDPFYVMNLYYPGLGIIVSIHGNAQVEGGLMAICPQDFMQSQLFPPPLLIWDPEVIVPYPAIETQVFGGLITRNTENYFLLESLTTDFTSEDFYQTYVDPNAMFCFEIDVSQWLP
jgi:hypothetical protein